MHRLWETVFVARTRPIPRHQNVAALPHLTSHPSPPHLSSPAGLGIYIIANTGSHSEHTNFEESTEVIKPLTEEEKKAKLAELRERCVCFHCYYMNNS